jgi:hypothetical protein
LFSGDSVAQSGKGEALRLPDKSKKIRKFNDIWLDISRNWSRTEMSRDADVFLPKAESHKERCSRHHIRQIMSFFFNLPQSVRNESTISVRNSLESTKHMARQELVYTDPKSGLSKVDYQSIEQTRPLLARQLKLEALLREIKHSLREIDADLFQRCDLEAELHFFKICDLSLDHDKHCSLLLLATRVIYEELSKQQLFDSSHLVYVLPDDLRLEDEIGRFTSVEGCLLFLDSWSLRRDVCFELFCLKVEIEDAHRLMGPDETLNASQVQNESICRLGWLHTVRKKKLESVTCASVEHLQTISDRFALLLDWYK